MFANKPRSFRQKLDMLSYLEHGYRDFFIRMEKLLKSRNYTFYTSSMGLCVGDENILDHLYQEYDYIHECLEGLEKSKSKLDNKLEKKEPKIEKWDVIFSGNNEPLFKLKIGDTFGNGTISPYLLKVEKITNNEIELVDIGGTNHYKFTLGEFLEKFDLVSFKEIQL